MRKLSSKILAALFFSFILAGAPIVFAQSTPSADTNVKSAKNQVVQNSSANDSVKNASANKSEAESKASAGEHRESSPLLSPEPGMILWTLILFVLTLIVLGKWVWPVVLKALKDREAKLTNDFQEAESARDEAKKTLAEYKKQLADAQREAQQIVNKSREDARKLSEQLKEKTQQDLSQMRERMESDIESAKQQAINEVHEQTALVATKIASRILRREIQENDQKNLVDYSIEEFGRISDNRDKQGVNNN